MSVWWRVIAVFHLMLLATSVGAQPGSQAHRERGDKIAKTKDTDTQLDELLASKKDPKIRFGELLRFNLSHRYLMGEVYLGSHGELFGGPHYGTTSPVGLVYYEYQGGLLLITLSALPELGLNALGRFAQVAPDGRVTCFVNESEVTGDVSSVPRFWPVPDDARPPRGLRPGEILFYPMPGSHPNDFPPPEGATGWAFVGIKGTLIMPLPGESRPENIVWVVPSLEGGFRLVYGGPRRYGELMMAVTSSGKVTVGANSSYALESRYSSEKSWILTKDNRAIMIPPGYSMHPLTDGMVRFWQSENGDIHYVGTRF